MKETQKDLVSFDLHRKQSLAVSGSKSGHVEVLDIKNNEVLASTSFSLPILGLAFLGEEDDNPRIIAITEQTAYSLVLTRESKTINVAQ